MTRPRRGGGGASALFPPGGERRSRPTDVLCCVAWTVFGRVWCVWASVRASEAEAGAPTPVAWPLWVLGQGSGAAIASFPFVAARSRGRAGLPQGLFAHGLSPMPQARLLGRAGAAHGGQVPRTAEATGRPQLRASLPGLASLALTLRFPDFRGSLVSVCYQRRPHCLFWPWFREKGVGGGVTGTGRETGQGILR